MKLLNNDKTIIFDTDNESFAVSGCGGDKIDLNIISDEQPDTMVKICLTYEEWNKVMDLIDMLMIS